MGVVVKWLGLRLSIERTDVRGPPWSVLVAWGWGNNTQTRKITQKMACSSQVGVQQRFADMSCTARMLVLSFVDKWSYLIVNNWFSNPKLAVCLKSIDDQLKSSQNNIIYKTLSMSLWLARSCFLASPI